VQPVSATIYNPGEVEPTIELFLSHKHPDDLARVKRLLRQAEAPFSSRHRIRTTTGEIRNVVVVGNAVTDADGQVVANRGFYSTSPRPCTNSAWPQPREGGGSTSAF
jgi:hypothetical protein